MGKAVDADRFYKVVKPFKAEVATTTIYEEQEKKLEAVLAREE